MAIACLSIGFVRSVYFTPSEPGSISEAQREHTVRQPPLIAWRAMNSAVDPVEQLF